MNATLQLRQRFRGRGRSMDDSDRLVRQLLQRESVVDYPHDHSPFESMAAVPQPPPLPTLADFVHHARWQIPSLPWDTIENGVFTVDNPNTGKRVHVQISVSGQDDVTILVHDMDQTTGETILTDTWSAAVAALKRLFLPRHVWTQMNTLD